MLRKFLFLPIGLLAVSVAGAGGEPNDDQPVQLAPVTVKAGPLAFVGIRCAVTTGFFGLISGGARIKDLVVIEVAGDSPAQRAGLVAKDSVLRIDGVPITEYTIAGLRKIGEREKGDKIEFEVISPGTRAPRMVEITLGAQKIPPK